jgi:hypothetical protein
MIQVLVPKRTSFNSQEYKIATFLHKLTYFSGFGNLLFLHVCFSENPTVRWLNLKWGKKKKKLNTVHS